jgi:hypothetical protein
MTEAIDLQGKYIYIVKATPFDASNGGAIVLPEETDFVVADNMDDAVEAWQEMSGKNAKDFHIDLLKNVFAWA